MPGKILLYKFPILDCDKPTHQTAIQLTTQLANNENQLTNFEYENRIANSPSSQLAI